MKTIILFITVCIFSSNAVAQEYNKTQKSNSTETYCAKMQDGKIMIMQDKKDITTDVALVNGSTIKPDGTVIKSDGSQFLLLNGECVDANGNRINPNDKMTKEEKMQPQ